MVMAWLVIQTIQINEMQQVLRHSLQGIVFMTGSILLGFTVDGGALQIIFLL